MRGEVTRPLTLWLSTYLPRSLSILYHWWSPYAKDPLREQCYAFKAAVETLIAAINVGIANVRLRRFLQRQRIRRPLRCSRPCPWSCSLTIATVATFFTIFISGRTRKISSDPLRKTTRDFSDSGPYIFKGRHNKLPDNRPAVSKIHQQSSWQCVLMAARKLAALLAALLHLCLCQLTPEIIPEFLAPLENHTVIQGRDVSFTCVVNHLQSYRVAWIKSDSRAILAIHTRMVTHNPRLSVTHNGHNTWKLHVSNVQKNDSGSYMCQVNTDPMRSQMGYMEVVVPPDILDDESADGLVTHEGGNLRLRCIATGIPQPTVSWKREDGRKIVLREDGKKQLVDTHDGEILELTGILRQEMGSYLCIASSSVPPRISKRYTISVHFEPLIRVTNQLVGAPVDSDVVLQCYVEASPHAMNTWYRDSGEKLTSNDKYTMSEERLNDYSWQMNLTVKSLKKGDFGGYVCSTVNALGKAEGCVRLQELQLVDKTTPSVLMKNTETRQRKKQITKEKKKTNGGNNNNRRKIPTSGDYDPDSIGNEDDIGTTQVMIGSTLYDGKTDRPLPVPSVSPPWINVNAGSSRQAMIIQNIMFLFFFLLRLMNIF